MTRLNDSMIFVFNKICTKKQGESMMNTKKVKSIYTIAASLMTMLLVFACGGGGGSSSSGGGKNSRVYETAEQVVDTIFEGAANEIQFAFRYVPKGRFNINGGWNSDEVEPAGTILTMGHTKGYLMAETQVTQELWEAVMGSTLVTNSGTTANLTEGEVQSQRPVDKVSWYHAIAFCCELSLLAGLTPVYEIEDVTWGETYTFPSTAAEQTKWNNANIIDGANGYRLPTDMQWWWAAMGADTEDPGELNETGYRKMFSGAHKVEAVVEAGDERVIGDYAWYSGNSNSTSHQVGKKLPNELGIYDMTGNVVEWVWDRHMITYAITEGEDDYQGLSGDGQRGGRGGRNNSNDTRWSRIANRGFGSQPNSPQAYTGMRLVRNAN